MQTITVEHDKSSYPIIKFAVLEVYAVSGQLQLRNYILVLYIVLSPKVQLYFWIFDSNVTHPLSVQNKEVIKHLKVLVS